MKTTITLFLAFFLSFGLYAQAPQKMTYQASIRNTADKPIANKAVSVRVSILQGSADAEKAVYAETHNPTTDVNGLVTFEIGGGTVINGAVDSIDWAKGPYFVKTETDPDGGSNYTITGVSQLLSVPYALHAHAAETLNVDSSSTGDLLTYDGTNWVAKKPVITISPTGNQLSHNNMQPYTVLNYCIALQGIYPSRSGADPFLGEIELYGFNFVPRGYALCDGSLMPISQNTALFSLLGTMFGGDGQSTFALPDLRGRVAVGQGTGPGLSLRTIGDKGGEEQHSLIVQELPVHNHQVTIVYE
jgi:microcystin-dependent protein